MNDEYTPREAQAWLLGYNERKKKQAWVNLTDAEISKLWNAPGNSGTEFARAIEALLREKNAQN